MDWSKVKVFGFSGKIGSGKNYIAENIFPQMYSNEEKGNILYIAFADLLKTICAGKKELTYEELYENKSSETRKLLQETGDEVRKMYGESFFKQALELEMIRHYKKNKINIFIITDVRFPEEALFIRHTCKGYVFRIEAPQRTNDRMEVECEGDIKKVIKISSHRSETLLDKFDFDLVIRNDYGQNPRVDISAWLIKN